MSYNITLFSWCQVILIIFTSLNWNSYPNKRSTQSFHLTNTYSHFPIVTWSFHCFFDILTHTELQTLTTRSYPSQKRIILWKLTVSEGDSCWKNSPFQFSQGFRIINTSIGVKFILISNISLGKWIFPWSSLFY